MKYIRRQLLEEIQKTDLPATELSVQASTQIRQAAWRHFAMSENWNLRGLFLWENLGTRTSIRGKFAWEFIDKILSQQPGDKVFMFFDERDKTPAFAFPRDVPIVPLLEQTSHFIFYLTNEELDYLICFNDHDFLIAAGTAIDALKSLQ